MKKLLILIIAVLFFILFAASSQAALVGNTTKATLSLSPQTGSYNKGDTFQVVIYVNTNNQNVDTVAAYINYDQAAFSIDSDSIDYTGSVFSFQAESSAINGSIKITRGITGGTVNASNGKVATLNFKALASTAPAADNLTFDFAAGNAAKSAVFLAGNYVLSGVYNAKYSVSGTDVTAPIISLVSASAITSNSATINWTTNEGSDSQVEYGTSAAYGSQTTLNSLAVTSRSILISNLSPSTTYHYRVKSKDAAGNLATSGDYTFTTAANTSGTLAVSLVVSPNSGKAPLNGVSLTASASGSVVGNANYTFYCNRSDSNTNISSGYAGKYDNRTETTYTAANICSYAAAGTYAAKVIVEKGSYQAEARVTITVSSANYLPVGAVDGADETHVTGWAYDRDAGTNSINVHVYIDGVFKASAAANLSRSDIIGAAGGVVGDGNHGFDFPFSSSGLSVGSHRVNIYAINTPEGTNPELAGSPRTIIVGNVSPLPSSSPSPSPSPSPNPSPSPSPSLEPIREGSLIRLAEEPKVYVIESGQRRWIPSLDAFVGRGYSWSNVQVIEESVAIQYPEGDPIAAAVTIPSEHANATLFRLANDAKVYALVGTKLHWVPNPAVFNLYKYQWSKIQAISLAQFNQYGQAKLFREAGGQKVYYLTKNGQKKWIINEAVFNAYGNKWEDVLEILPEELSAYPAVNLVRQGGDAKVYLLDGTTKHWIPTPEIFTQKGYKWENIDSILEAEINEYQNGADVE